MTNILACDGSISLNNVGRPSCDTGFYLIDEESIGLSNAITDLTVILNSMFAQPSTPEMVAAFGAGISLPLITYLVSWGYQSVISFMGARDESGYLDD
jgi:hypothetical protein